MTHKNENRAPGAILSLMIIATGLLSGCAGKGGLYQPPGQPPEATVPFAITFDLKGNPVVIDREGRAIPPQEVEFPIRQVNAIGSVTTISAIEVHGSHYYILKIGGNIYHIPLPAPHPR